MTTPPSSTEIVERLLEKAIKRAKKVQAIEIEVLADKYRDTLRADGYHGLAPWRYGWSIRDAFIVGMLFGEARAALAKTPADLDQKGPHIAG